MSCYECASRLPETAQMAGVEECPLYSLMCSVFDPSDEGDAMVIANAIAKISTVVKCAHEIPQMPGSDRIIEQAQVAELRKEDGRGP